MKDRTTFSVAGVHIDAVDLLRDRLRSCTGRKSTSTHIETAGQKDQRYDKVRGTLRAAIQNTRCPPGRSEKAEERDELVEVDGPRGADHRLGCDEAVGVVRRHQPPQQRQPPPARDERHHDAEHGRPEKPDLLAEEA